MHILNTIYQDPAQRIKNKKFHLHNMHIPFKNLDENAFQKLWTNYVTVQYYVDQYKIQDVFLGYLMQEYSKEVNLVL